MTSARPAPPDLLRPRRRLSGRPVVLALAVLAGLGALDDAQAQRTYRCQGPNGYYYADRPCVMDNSTKLGAFGPVPEPSTPPPRSQGPIVIQRAPDHLSYMSPECASLSDGIRTAPSRGLSYDTINQLRRDYSQRCSADEARARQRLASEQSRTYMDGARQRVQIATESRREDQAARQLMDQCAEMRRSIASRQERIASLTPGEVADLHRFEANYAQRCQSGKTTP